MMEWHKPLEGQRRIVVVDDRGQLFLRDPRLFQAIVDGIVREAAIILDAREALFLRRGHNLAIANQSRSRVVIEARDPQDRDRVTAELPASPAVTLRCPQSADRNAGLRRRQQSAATNLCCHRIGHQPVGHRREMTADFASQCAPNLVGQIHQAAYSRRRRGRPQRDLPASQTAADTPA